MFVWYFPFLSKKTSPGPCHKTCFLALCVRTECVAPVNRYNISLNSPREKNSSSRHLTTDSSERMRQSLLSDSWADCLCGCERFTPSLHKPETRPGTKLLFWKLKCFPWIDNSKSLYQSPVQGIGTRHAAPVPTCSNKGYALKKETRPMGKCKLFYCF